MALSTAMSRGQSLLRELMRASLGNHVNTLILEKAADAGAAPLRGRRLLRQDAERAARGLDAAAEHGAGDGFARAADADPRSATRRCSSRLSPLVGAAHRRGLGPCVHRRGAASRGESFRLNTWRAPEGRRLNYLEWILTRDSHVKEVKLFDLGPLVLGRYRALFDKFYAEDRALALRKSVAGLALGLVSPGARSTALRLHGGAGGARRHHARRPHALPRPCSARARRAFQSILASHRRHLRGRALHVATCSPTWTSRTGGEQSPRRCRRWSPRAGAGAGDRAARRLLPLPGQGDVGAARRHRSRSRRARSWRWWARTARARAR